MDDECLNSTSYYEVNKTLLSVKAKLNCFSTLCKSKKRVSETVICNEWKNMKCGWSSSKTKTSKQQRKLCIHAINIKICS